MKRMGEGSGWRGGGGDGDLRDMVRSRRRRRMPLRSLLRAEISSKLTLVLQRDRPALPSPLGIGWGLALLGSGLGEGTSLTATNQLRGWKRHLLPSTYGHTTQEWLFSRTQPQHRLIANNTFYENI